MADVKLLWRRANRSTLDTLRGESRGQHDIRLGRHTAIDDFFAGLPRVPDHNGSRIEILIERMPSANGATEIPPYQLAIRRMSDESERAGEWYIRAQRPATAYPLWRPGNGPLDSTQANTDHVFLVRVANDRFYGGWLRQRELQELPDELKARIADRAIGVAVVGDSALSSLVPTAIEPASDSKHPSGENRGDEIEQGIVEAPEGRTKTVLHVRRERSRRLRAAKIASMGGNPKCEACGFDFAQAYGDRGKGFIECHHIIPVADLDPGRPTRLEDLALLCANCHRMIHAERPWLSVEQLRTLLG